MGWEKDLPAGEQLVACFRPFLEELVASELSPKTIQKHVDNLWALGGAIIRDLNAPCAGITGRVAERSIPHGEGDMWIPLRIQRKREERRDGELGKLLAY